MGIRGISHITLLCENIERSAQLFCVLFGAVEVYSSEKKNFSISKEKFLLIEGLWIALMQGQPVERSYNHIAFHIDEEALPVLAEKIQILFAVLFGVLFFNDHITIEVLLGGLVIILAAVLPDVYALKHPKAKPIPPPPPL